MAVFILCVSDLWKFVCLLGISTAVTSKGLSFLWQHTPLSDTEECITSSYELFPFPKFTYKASIQDRILVLHQGSDSILSLGFYTARSDQKACKVSLYIQEMIGKSIVKGKYGSIYIGCHSDLQLNIETEERQYNSNLSLQILGLRKCAVTWNSLLYLTMRYNAEELAITQPTIQAANDDMIPINIHHSPAKVLDFSSDPTHRSAGSGWISKALKSLPPDSFSHLEMISFVRVNLSSFDPEGFYHLRQLSIQTYVFIDTWIRYIPSLVFNTNFTQPVNKRKILLNNIRKDSVLKLVTQNSIEKLAISNVNLGSLEYQFPQLDIKGSLISSIPNDTELLKLHRFVLTSSLLTGDKLWQLQHLRNVRLLDLSSNQLRHVPDNAFNGFHELVSLDLRNCQISSIKNIQWHGTGKLKSLQIADNYVNYLAITDLLSKVPSLAHLNTVNSRIKFVNASRGINVKTNMQFLQLDENDLQTFPENILHLAIPAISFLGNLISSAGLKTLISQRNVYSPKSRGRGSLNLIFNCIEYIPLETPDDIKSFENILERYNIYLHYNPLHCGCEEFLVWIAKLGMKNSHYLFCDKESLWLAGQKVIQIKQKFPENRCSLNTKRYPYKCNSETLVLKGTICGLLALIVLIAVICIVYVVYRKRFFICYTFFKFTKWKVFRLRHTNRNANDFDALVLHTRDSVNLCIQLSHFLEMPPMNYKLCIEYRDFAAGVDHGFNIMDMMSKSKVCLIILTPNFADNEWFGFTINAAMEESRLREYPYRMVSLIADGANLNTCTQRQKKFMQVLPKLYVEDEHLLERVEFFLGKPLSGRNSCSVSNSDVILEQIEEESQV